MVNQEHFEVLKKGIVAWNEWRKQHPDTRPDLYAADLSGAYLSKTDVDGANLSRAIQAASEHGGLRN